MSTTSRNWGFDLARSLAISGVVILHITVFYAPPRADRWLFQFAGFQGVELFFALSGVLIGRILYQDHKSGHSHPMRFLARRWLRTLPAFLVAFCIIAAFREPSLSVLFQRLFFIHNFSIEGAVTGDRFFSVSWSLAIEEWFYFILALLFLLFRPKNFFLFIVILYIVLLLGRTAILLSHYSSYEWNMGHKWIPVRLDALFPGLLVACWLSWRPSTIQKICMLSAGSLGIITTAYIFEANYLLFRNSPDSSLWVFVGNSVCCALFVGGLSVLEKLNFRLPRFVEKPVTYLSVTSYSLYLYHFDIFRLVQGIWGNDTSFTLLALMVSFFIAHLSYHYVERPFINWRDKRFPKTASFELGPRAVDSKLSLAGYDSGLPSPQKLDR